jgi:hypothetical protein
VGDEVTDGNPGVDHSLLLIAEAVDRYAMARGEPFPGAVSHLIIVAEGNVISLCIQKIEDISFCNVLGNSDFTEFLID